MTALCGAIGTCAGAWIKVFSVHPDLFYVGFIGQSIVATSQVILLIYLPIFSLPILDFSIFDTADAVYANIKCQCHDKSIHIVMV